MSIRDKLGVQSPIDVVRWLNLLVYGEYGAGKTWLCGTAQDHEATRPVLLMDVEGGVTTLRHRRDIDVVKVRTSKDVEKVYNTLLLSKEIYYKTVVLDSLTELQDLDMRVVQKDELGRLGEEKVDIDVPSQRAWGKNGNRVKMIIRGFKDLEINFIATCLLGEHYDDDAKTTDFFPQLPGKLRKVAPGYFDIVGMLKSEVKGRGNDAEIIRTLQTLKTQRVAAKDRTSALPHIITNPDIPMLMAMINAPGVTLTEENEIESDAA